MRSNTVGGLRRGATLGMVMLGGVMLTGHARAQFFSGPTGAPSVGNKDNSPVYRQVAPPPSALPGAETHNGPAPAATPPAMMDPTQALFDAINRGDISVARDAISRGADVNGQNELGMTPIQLSVDLGHNDLTFLLLSNGAGQPSGGPASGAVQQAAKTPAKAVKVARRKPAHAERMIAEARTGPELPQLYAGNGGAPIPSAGFLGFNPGR